MNKEEKEDILFDIDMQLYDEFNDKFCEINDNLGTVYTYQDLEDLKQVEKDKEIKLLREAIKKQQAEIETLKRDFEIVDHECSRLEKEDIKKDKLINILAEQLTTPVHSKEWVIDYYKREIENDRSTENM